ncbi:type III secretion system inner membrane ring subunit SctD [Providencia sp. Me31A]
MSSSVTLHLKFLNGPMKGYGLDLPEGKVTLGKGDVDIQAVFDNGTQTIELDVNESHVVILSDANCWVDGWPYNEKQLPLDKVINLAGFAFILLTDESHFDINNISEKQIRARRRLSKLKKNIITIFSVISVALVIVGIIRIDIFSGAENKNLSPFEIINRLKKGQSNISLSSLEFGWSKEKILRISGKCRKQEDLERLLMYLKGEGIYWSLETQCQDKLRENIEDLLIQEGYQQIKVSDGEKIGEVIIRGNIKADKHWERVVRQLMEYSELTRWSVENKKMDRLEVINALRKLGLLGKITIYKQEDKWVVSGLLTPKQQNSIKEELEAIFESNEKDIIFQNISISNFSRDGIFPQPITSIGGNKRNSYVILLDGRRLQVGSRLNNDFEIVNIDPLNGIDVYKEGQLLHIAL